VPPASNKTYSFYGGVTATMAEPITNIAATSRPNRIGVWLRSSLPAMVISMAATIWCRATVGPTLGLFLGSLLLTTLVTPSLALAEEGHGFWIAMVSVIVGTAIIWLTALTAADVTAWEWLECSFVLAAYVFALAGVARLFAALRVPRPPAAGVTVLLGLLWLTWPVWLSPWLTQAMADWLVPANPVFAVNSVLKHLGTWDRAPLAYRLLTVLNQDVPYRLPGSIVPACIAHALLGTGAVLLGRLLGSAKR
jgi:hypothetical protein